MVLVAIVVSNNSIVPYLIMFRAKSDEDVIDAGPGAPSFIFFFWLDVFGGGAVINGISERDGSQQY